MNERWRCKKEFYKPAFWFGANARSILGVRARRNVSQTQCGGCQKPVQQHAVFVFRRKWNHVNAISRN